MRERGRHGSKCETSQQKVSNRTGLTAARQSNKKSEAEKAASTAQHMVQAPPPVKRSSLFQPAPFCSPNRPPPLAPRTCMVCRSPNRRCSPAVVKSLGWAVRDARPAVRRCSFLALAASSDRSSSSLIVGTPGKQGEFSKMRRE